ncbi:hypothetical protein ACLMAL_00980 [Nocardia sp. CWNU-33]|uniref:hypothetical protein n=1 Tax=Nocardia sp. CWNU-33 TaxID=3392117 RepID=UPI00398F788E
MLLEAVAAGASLVIVPDAADPATSPADEWVTHLLADRTTLDAMDMTLPADLQTVVLDAGSTVASVAVPGSVALVLLDELLDVGEPVTNPRPQSVSAVVG